MTMKERIGEIRERIEKASIRSGRKPEDTALMGVSKFHGPAEIEEAFRCGITLFGESRVQEAAKKFPSLKEAYPSLAVHMIGRLQRNKTRAALKVFDGIQSLDRDELITSLGSAQTGTPVSAKTGTERERPLPVLLELHTGEESKSGYAGFDSLLRAAELALSFSGLALSGLMTLAPFTKDQTILRRSFRTLVKAQDLLRKRFPGGDFSVLSMGMSGDFETAVEEGSTLVRIGQAIFGEREPLAAGNLDG